MKAGRTHIMDLIMTVVLDTIQVIDTVVLVIYRPVDCLGDVLNVMRCIADSLTTTTTTTTRPIYPTLYPKPFPQPQPPLRPYDADRQS